MSDIRSLNPQPVWNHFADLNAVPRPSKKEGKVLNFLKNFAQGLDLEYEQDDIGNLVIRKPATAGMENRRPVVMQSHVDMVHQKNEDTDFDFEKEGIRMKIDGEWVKAEGTTLGSDNGMGVAAIMAVLSSENLPHPAIEGLFTVDEEAGMTGAQELKTSWLKGEILLNLDTEEDDELSIGCAGGVDINVSRNYITEEIKGSGLVDYELSVSGLSGGHSGMDIIRGRGNANKIMNRLLLNTGMELGLRISEIDGGGLRNAIPRESKAKVKIMGDQTAELEAHWDALIGDLRNEFMTTDPDLKIEYRTSSNVSANVMTMYEQAKFLYAIQACHDGIKRLSPDVENLVETSNNLARVSVKNGKMEMKCLTRSDRESAKWNMAHSVASAFHLMDAEVDFSGSYPGWKLDPNAPMLGTMKNLYIKLFDEKPRILACHAGLECGLIGQHYPSLEMVSFGPTIRGAHSPDERVSIPSVQKFWRWLTAALKRIPERQLI